MGTDLPFDKMDVTLRNIFLFCRLVIVFQALVSRKHPILSMKSRRHGITSNRLHKKEVFETL